jgi:hypothetical protein
VVFVDHAAEDLPAPHWRIKGHDDWLVMMGWPLLRGFAVRLRLQSLPGRQAARSKLSSAWW